MPSQSKHRRSSPISLAAAAKRRRWRKEEALVVVSAWRKSGLTVQEFGSRHGLPQARLEKWSRTLGTPQTPRVEAPLEFVPVAVPRSAAREPDGSRLALMELALPSGIRVTVGAGFDAEALERLLGVVGC